MVVVSVVAALLVVDEVDVECPLSLLSFLFFFSWLLPLVDVVVDFLPIFSSSCSSFFSGVDDEDAAAGCSFKFVDFVKDKECSSSCRGASKRLVLGRFACRCVAALVVFGVVVELERYHCHATMRTTVKMRRNIHSSIQRGAEMPNADKEMNDMTYYNKNPITYDDDDDNDS